MLGIGDHGDHGDHGNRANHDKFGAHSTAIVRFLAWRGPRTFALLASMAKGVFPAALRPRPSPTASDFRRQGHDDCGDRRGLVGFGSHLGTP